LVAVTPNERLQATVVKATAEILLGRAREGLTGLDAANSELEKGGSLFLIHYAPRGIALAMTGRISEGIRVIEQEINKSEAIGDQTRAAWSRGRQLPTVSPVGPLWAVKSISRSQGNGGFCAHSSPSRGDPFRSVIRPNVTYTARFDNVRLTSIRAILSLALNVL
jgi:hypothetical protein